MSRDLVRHGSSKDIYCVEPGTLDFVFTDDFSVFDVGKHPQRIPGKGRAVCAAAVQSFRIAERVGVPTHFIKQVDEETIRIREAQVITDRPLTAADTNLLVPAEWIDRLYVAGSFWRDFQSGKKKPTAYGFLTDAVPAEGKPFPWPILHFTTKFEKHDRDLTPNEARAMTGLTEQDVADFWAMISRLKGAIDLVLAKAGYVRFDGKCEVLVMGGSSRQKMIGDAVVTQDEDRPVLAAPLQQWVVEHHNKEYLRQWFITNGYYNRLQLARAAKQPDPPFPTLPEEVIAEASRRYCAFAEAYTSIKV